MLQEVSVYICTYQEQNNIRACINAVKKNGVNNIFVVDASTDAHTKKEAEKAGAIVLGAKKGLAGQRQKAIEHCNTPFLMFVDADDRLRKECVSVLLRDMKKNKYDAVQAQLRVYSPRTYMQKAMNANLRYCICIPGPTSMVGRPALYRTRLLKKVGMDVSFNNIGNEDAALSIRMEKQKAKQGIGHGISYRHHPPTWKENWKAWEKYGKGDANLIRQYPQKTWNVLKHVLYVYPIKRSYILIKNKKGIYCGYGIGIGLVRFIYMLKQLLFGFKK